MSSFILDFVNLNSTMNYSMIIPAVILYLMIFWIVISTWLYFDAKKRYRSWKKALGISLLNLFFQLPFLVFYLLVRPFDGEEQFMEVDDGGDSSVSGGVNVPLINFVGNEGVVMSLELKINSPKLASESHPEMKIDVNFESSDPDKQLLVKPVQESISQVGGVKVTQTIGEVVQVNKPAGIAGKIKASWEQIQKSIKERRELAEKEMKAKEEAKKLSLKEQQDKKLAQHAAQGIEIIQSSEQSSKKQKKNKNKKRH